MLFRYSSASGVGIIPAAMAAIPDRSARLFYSLASGFSVKILSFIFAFTLSASAAIKSRCRPPLTAPVLRHQQRPNKRNM